MAKAANFIRRNFLLCFGALGFILFLSVWLPYVYVFGTKLSTDHDIWNQFGGYFGGTLGPVFSFMGFIAVVVSIRTQTRQQRDAQKQARLDLLQNLIDLRSGTIESSLQRHYPDPNRIVGRSYEGSAPLSKLMSRIGISARYIENTCGTETSDFVEPAVREAYNSVTFEIDEVAGSLAALALQLTKWRSAGGDEELVAHYQRLFSTPILNMHQLGLSGSQKLFEEAFPTMRPQLDDVADTVRIEPRPADRPQ